MSSSNAEFAAIRMINRALIPKVTANGLLVAAVMAACKELNGSEGVPSPGPGALESAQKIDSSPHRKSVCPGGPGGPAGPGSWSSPEHLALNET